MVFDKDTCHDSSQEHQQEPPLCTVWVVTVGTGSDLRLKGNRGSPGLKYCCNRVGRVANHSVGPAVVWHGLSTVNVKSGLYH